MEKKIIHFTIRHSKGDFISKDDPNFFFIGWATLQAKGLAKINTEIEQEVWRPDFEVDKMETGVLNNVKGRLFPHRGLSRKFHLNPLLLLRELKRKCKNNRVIINLHYVHDLASMIVIFLFRRYPIVIHHHGSIPFPFKEKKGGIKKLFNKICIYLDERLLKKVDFFSVVSPNEKAYLGNFIDSKRIKLEQGRKYLKDWKPLEKKKARERTGIDEEKKVIVYIGYYYKLKGLENLLFAFKELKKRLDVELVVAGGSPQDPLYELVKKSGARDLGFISNDEIRLVLSAADVYCAPALEGTWMRFGGPGTSMIEALACDVPVVSRQLFYFPSEDWKTAGEIPESREDVSDCISKILESPESYSPRKVAEKYFDFEKILKSNMLVYKALFETYYK